jgi:hypothetical protein
MFDNAGRTAGGRGIESPILARALQPIASTDWSGSKANDPGIQGFASSSVT